MLGITGRSIFSGRTRIVSIFIEGRKSAFRVTWHRQGAINSFISRNAAFMLAQVISRTDLAEQFRWNVFPPYAAKRYHASRFLVQFAAFFRFAPLRKCIRQSYEAHLVVSCFLV
jgi:hypothetical protein